MEEVGQVVCAFGSLAFATALWYSTFIKQEGVGCHPSCLLMLSRALSRCIVNGYMHLQRGPVPGPQEDGGNCAAVGGDIRNMHQQFVVTIHLFGEGLSSIWHIMAQTPPLAPG